MNGLSHCQDELGKVKLPNSHAFCSCRGTSVLPYFCACLAAGVMVTDRSTCWASCPQVCDVMVWLWATFICNPYKLVGGMAGCSCLGMDVDTCAAACGCVEMSDCHCGHKGGNLLWLHHQSVPCAFLTAPLFGKEKETHKWLRVVLCPVGI